MKSRKKQRKIKEQLPILSWTGDAQISFPVYFELFIKHHLSARLSVCTNRAAAC